MANENKLSYLQMPIPSGKRYYRMVKRSWSGLNYKQTIDTGALSSEKNVSTLEAPYLIPSQSRNIQNIKEYKISDITDSNHSLKCHYQSVQEVTAYLDGLSSSQWQSNKIVLYTAIFDNNTIPCSVYIEKSGSTYKLTEDVWPNQSYSLSQWIGGQIETIGMHNFRSSNITLTAYGMWLLLGGEYANPIGMYGFDDFLIVIYRSGTSIYVDHISYNANEDNYTIYTGVLQSEGATANDEYPRCLVQFNVYDTPTDPVSGQYVKKLLIFPDKKSMDFEINENFTISDMSVLIKEYTNATSPYFPPDAASHNYYYRNTSNSKIYKWVDDISDTENTGWKESVPPTMPNIKYAAVHLSRLFGADDHRVYASGYNDYTNWNLDTIDEYSESNAWCSPAQSNTKAGGKFTGITNYQGHIVCFKRDFMHEIYNTKNPFRIQDVYAEGTIDNRTIQDVDGKLIFVSEDNVKIYTGSDPRIISYYLNIPKYVNAVSGTDGRCYYLYCEDTEYNKRLFVYDTIVEQWSEQDIQVSVLNFAHNKNGMYMLCRDGNIYKMDTGKYDQAWSFETDLITNDTVDIKHIKKMQMLAYIAQGSIVKVYMLYDDEEFNPETSHLVYSSSGYGQKPIRVKPRQSASYGIKLHIEGFGYVKLYELELFVENGGDLYK